MQCLFHITSVDCFIFSMLKKWRKQLSGHISKWSTWNCKKHLCDASVVFNLFVGKFKMCLKFTLCCMLKSLQLPQDDGMRFTERNFNGNALLLIERDLWFIERKEKDKWRKSAACMKYERSCCCYWRRSVNHFIHNVWLFHFERNDELCARVCDTQIQRRSVDHGNFARKSPINWSQFWT